MKKQSQPTPPPSRPRAKAAPAPVDLSQESVAGEEDPGVAVDLGLTDPPHGSSAPAERGVPDAPAKRGTTPR